KRQLEWSNGTIGYAFSSEDPEQLRGSQFGAAWFESKTIWGALLAVTAAVAGALFAIYGRLTATDMID
ncbi:MAG: hypothetical protein QM488_02680, partial [Rhizobiaceae bacterium]